MGWLSGWSYRKSITLSRSSGAVSNYQMKLLVGESSGATGESVDCEGNCLSTFNDLRFTKSDGTTLLDYHILSITGTTPNQLATVWIKFDSIGTSDTTFFMYYGKSDASAASNGANTFVFFDDFPGSSLDTTTNWTTANESSGSITVTGGTCKLSVSGTSDRAKIISKTSFSTNTALCASIRYKKVVSHEQNLRIGYLYDTPSANRVTYYANTYQSVFKWNTIASGSGTDTSDNPFTSEVYYVVEWIRNGSTSAIYTVDGSTKATHTTNVPTGSLPAVFDVDNDGTNTWYAELEWVFVRDYLSQDATWGAWGSQEEVPKFFPNMKHHYIPPFLGGS